MRQLKIVKHDKRKYSFKVVTGGVVAGALLVGFIATKSTEELMNPEDLPINGWIDFAKDYLDNCFKSLKGTTNTTIWDCLKPENDLETALIGLFAGTKIWQYVQVAKKNKVKKEIRNIEMGR